LREHKQQIRKAACRSVHMPIGYFMESGNVNEN
jgi:hypothetical protein